VTSLERVLKTLSHQEPDRVPLFLLLTLHGAKALGLSIEDYFSDARNVVEGQIRLRRRYGHDCYYPFFHAPLEVEAWGGEVLFADDGPPNSGRPPIARVDQIAGLEAPAVADSPGLRRALSAIEGLAHAGGGDAPIIGVVMSPFSLPVMQMGFGPYLELMLERRSLFWQLMAVNEAFCVAWANAQLAAGAHAICYFDPVSSATIVPPTLYRETGFEVARRTIAQIAGPTVTHAAAGRFLPIIDDLAQTGTLMVGTSVREDLAEVKAACAGRLAVMGNLNGIEMARWTPAEAQRAVRDAIAAGAPGGGFILSDNHGEIPFQVPGATLEAIAEATREWGRYPL
jgi:uroporphyrinogen decarboxylase